MFINQNSYSNKVYFGSIAGNFVEATGVPYLNNIVLDIIDCNKTGVDSYEKLAQCFNEIIPHIVDVFKCDLPRGNFDAKDKLMIDIIVDYLIGIKKIFYNNPKVDSMNQNSAVIDKILKNITQIYKKHKEQIPSDLLMNNLQ